jgi:hypothetical protein
MAWCLVKHRGITSTLWLPQHEKSTTYNWAENFTERDHLGEQVGDGWQEEEYNT